jgi:hypothetical protein
VNGQRVRVGGKRVCCQAHLRYTQGEAPFGRTVVYNDSIAFLILLDSTRRSAWRISITTVCFVGPPETGGLTVDEQQPAPSSCPIGIGAADPSSALCSQLVRRLQHRLLDLEQFGGERGCVQEGDVGLDVRCSGSGDVG